MVYEIFRELRRDIGNMPGYRITLLVHPDIAALLHDEESKGLEELEQQHQKQIGVNARPSFHQEQFEIIVG
jgi:ribonuclease G